MGVGRPERRRRSANWEDAATLNLAKAGLQNECTDRRIFERIPSRTWLLVAVVRQEDWSEVVDGWCENEDE